MRPAVISGISPNFLELSQSRGQVAHVLLTRSPLEPHLKGWASFDLHVLSTPPAFVLSQDQTLRRCLNPGENQELALLMSINPKKPTKGLLLGTDFRHAVEFSRSGRAPTRPSRASSMAACCPTLRRDRMFPLRDRPAGLSASRGASRTIPDSGGRCTGGPGARIPGRLTAREGSRSPR